MSSSTEHLMQPNQETYSQEWFKSASLEAFKQALRIMPYPGYPTTRLHGSPDTMLLPEGTWHMPSDSICPTGDEAINLVQNGHRLDMFGRPLHPWLEDMLNDPDIGVVTGKGFYWKWGPNYTVDPIIFRHDLNEPHVLLIERADGTGWALPGGFKDQGETEQEGAKREAWEEAGINLDLLHSRVRRIYEGPLADLRATAHAWPETTAFCFDLSLDSKFDRRQLAGMMADKRWKRTLRSVGRLAFKEKTEQLPWKGRDDARSAAWVPVSELDDKLFGSHRLLIELALQQS